MSKQSRLIKIEEGDAVEFIHQVRALLVSLAKKYDVGDVVFVKIKNWFDHKWLNYSGKKVVHFETSHPAWGREESLENTWLKSITIPPFNPNRVLSSKFFRAKDTGNTKIESAINQYQRSTEASKALVSEYTSDGLMLWYSSNTLSNQKGSILVYISKDEEVTSWYAQFENIGGWRITRSKGVNIGEIQLLAGERSSV
ncbi:MAG: hypothetical protein ABL999_09530 [Pyrinomonadaceae bacterium]